MDKKKLVAMLVGVGVLILTGLGIISGDAKEIICSGQIVKAAE